MPPRLLQIWNDEAVCNVFGSHYKFDCFAFLERNLRRGEGKALCVNLNGSRRILCSGKPKPLDKTTHIRNAAVLLSRFINPEYLLFRSRVGRPSPFS